MPTTQVSLGLIDAPGSYGFRNRIINGDMRIDQRNAGASVTNVAGSSFSSDRFELYGSNASKFTGQQNAGAVTPPAGFSKYLGITSLSAYSVAAVERYAVVQKIEGFNTADLMWGSASAATITLSFWVRSSLTGTFGGAFRNGGTPTPSYPFTYTISAANTWEYKTITISGPTTGTWATDNTSSIQVWFSLGTGATYSGPAGAWAATDYSSATGATSVVGTNGATFYITGVQLEAGSVATPFERRDYGRELMMCYRYCEVFRRTAGGTDSDIIGTGVWTGTTNVDAPWIFKVQKRAAPTITFSGTSGFEFLRSALAWEAVTSWTATEPSAYAVRIGGSVGTGDTRGFATEMRITSSTAYIIASAEL